MPGLFGIVTLERGRELNSSAVKTFEEMAVRLCHLGRERVERCEALERGFLIGRVGLAELASLPFSTGSTFYDGIVHRDAQVQPDDHLDSLDLARGLEGFWSLVRIKDDQVCLAVDRRSSRPLAFAVVDGHLIFAPEVKALLAWPGFDRRVDPGALGLFFASGFLLAHQTFFRSAQRLEGGTCLRLDRRDAAVTIEKYADYRFSVAGDGTPYEEIKAELGATVRRAVERNLEHPEREAIFLSGGKDSRLIIAAAAARAGDPRQVQAISWAADDPQPGSDVFLARQIARQLGVNYREVRRTLDGFGQKALRLSYILDCATDVGAFHGDELRLMEDLAADGLHKVLRGDQCFTRGRAMLSPAYAILRMCIRSSSGLARGAQFWRQEAFAAIAARGDEYLAVLGAEFAGLDQDNVGDQVYFRHRLQGYLNSAGYFKSLVLDHRNPLLDEAILRLIQRLSIAARREQRILNEMGRETFPEVFGLPFADKSNLEDYLDLLSSDTPVRRAVAIELADDHSAAWEWLDRRALQAELENLSRRGGSQGWRTKLKRRIKDTVRDAVYGIPALDTRLRGVYLRRETRPDEVLLRAVALKHFFDLFVDGDGGRPAFEKQRERIAHALGRG